VAKQTVLEITQDILSDMDSDTVNSITDSVESLQVAQIIKTTYFEIITEGEWPHLGQMFQVTASGDSSLPTHMTIPDNVQYVEWLKYDKRKASTDKAAYLDVEYKDPLEFVEHLNQRDSTNANVVSVSDPGGSTLLILNNTAPTYYTSFDNDVIVLDSFNAALESTTQSSKVQCYGYREPVFSILDTFVPDLPSKAFPYLMSEAKSVAFNTLKQSANQKEEQRSNRQRRRMSQDRWRVAGGITYPNYGRRSKK